MAARPSRGCRLSSAGHDAAGGSHSDIPLAVHYLNLYFNYRFAKAISGVKLFLMLSIFRDAGKQEDARGDGNGPEKPGLHSPVHHAWKRRMSTIGKALALLDSLCELDRDIGLSDLARLSALDKATTRRFLVELEKYGFVEQDGETRKYRLGAAPVRLARIRQARFPFASVAAPFVKALADAVGETVHLSEFAGGRLATIHVEDSTQAHRVIVDVGATLPLHATASGLAFLAFLPKAEADRALARPLQRFSPETVIDADAVRTLLAETAARGFSVNRQGFETGVISAAAPIVAPNGRPVGALAVAAPIARADSAKILDIGERTAAAAGAIAEKYYGTKR